MSIYIKNNTSEIQMAYNNVGTNVDVTVSDLNSTGSVYISGYYMI